METGANPVEVAVRDHVATVTMNRPEAMNSLDDALKGALLEALQGVAQDDDVRCVVLTATGRAFCVGQDLREHADFLQQPGAELGSVVTGQYSPLVRLLLTMDKPVVAAVNGVAAGAGVGLALAADLRILAEKASYSLAFAGIGLPCDTGLSWTLPRAVGVARAKELLLSPDPVRADEALRLGLATEVVPGDELAGRAQEVAARLAAGPTRAYGEMRRAVAAGSASDLDTALAGEAEAMTRAGATADHRDAVAAFLAKEQPTFTGR